MQTLAPKQNHPQNKTICSFVHSKIPIHGPYDPEHPACPLQRAIGNQAVGQLLARTVKASNSQGQFTQHKDRAANKTGLPDNLKAEVESLSGLAMDDVRVFYNSSKPAEVQALAHTQGRNIYVGPGQDKYLPHEAWHVVQQKQGRVNPMDAQTKGASINDDPGLESEADWMGALASRTNLFQPAGINIEVPAAQPVQREVIQRQKVPTGFGEFETTQFEEANDRGVKIKLEFKPNENKVDARKIALSQSVKAIKETGAAYATTPNIANRIVPSGKPGAGYAIDAPGSTNNPIYYDTKYLAPTEELKDTPLSGNNPANPVQLGVNTNYTLGYCYKEKPTDTKKKQSAALYDMPQGRKKKGAGMQFETAAFAIEGADKDKYYGSVKWGYKLDGTDASLTVTKMDITEASRGTPTANFMEAAKLWTVAKTQGTLKVIADPANVYKMDLSTTETIPKGITLKQLDTIGGGSEPMIKAEVLNADGTGSGKLIYINVPDVKDMGDGSPNKKLPV